MKVLVYGAGSIGSLYAALLKESGHDVSILARGKRLADIRENGIQLENAATGKLTESSVNPVSRFEPNDVYDLVLVALPKNHVSEVLPILAANSNTPTVMFFGNNAAGTRELIETLGLNRVLLGFPGAAAVASDHRLRYLILSSGEQPTTIGEVDGRTTSRIKAIEEAFQAAGFTVAISSNMDAWLKTHAAEISPTANALYLAETDRFRLGRTRDGLLSLLRAIREGYSILKAHGIPITPAHHRIFEWIPEPLLIIIMRRLIESDTMGIKSGHALGARDEMKTIADELLVLARAKSISTPAMLRLYAYLDPTEKPLADGSAQLPVKWGGLGALGAIFVALAVLISMLWRSKA